VSRSEAYQKSLILVEAGQYERAFEYITEYLKENKDNGKAWNDGGAILYSLGQVKKAIEFFERARDLHCEHGQIYSNLAEAYLANGQPGKVVELFEQMQNLGVLDAEIVEGTVKAFMECGDKVSAMETALRAVRYSQQHERFEPLLSDIRSKRAKIAFFCGADGTTFLEDILDFTRQRFHVRFFNGKTYNEVYDLMKWSDISWFEWCTEIAVKASQMPKVCKNIVRLHRYEAFTHWPMEVNWENIDTLITVGNEFVCNRLKRKIPGIEFKTRMVEIFNGINLEKFKFIEKPRGKNIAFVGNLNMKKNPAYLLHCFNALRRMDSDYRLFLVGRFQDEVLEQYMQYMVDELGLNGSVFFGGWHDDMNTWLADKHYIVCSSIVEGHPVGVMEAMACGLKPVIHNFPGSKKLFPREFLYEGVEGFCEMILSGDYEPMRYRRFIEEAYPLSEQLRQINKLFVGFEREPGSIRRLKQTSMPVGTELV